MKRHNHRFASQLLVSLGLLGAPRALARVPVHVVEDETDRPYRLVANDSGGRPSECTLPTPGGCHLTLAAGLQQVRIETRGESIDQELLVPSTGADLRLSHHSKIMGWVGLGIAGEGAGDLLLTALYSGMSNTAAAQTAGMSQFYQDLAIGAAIVGGAVIVGGVIVAALGFHRAGSEVVIEPAGLEPSEPTASAAPPAVAGPQPLGQPSPPPLPNTQPDWTNGAQPGR